jgi:thioredoxin reductase (NADPH)
VIIATGVSYRRLNIPDLEELVGRGVYYGAPTSEMAAIASREAFIVGGGNSAGQAALSLARHAYRVTLLVRGTRLADSMSDYLIREISAAPNVDVAFRKQVVGVGGKGQLEYLLLKDLESENVYRNPAQGLFVLIGAEPHTEWLHDVLRCNPHGFIATGLDLLEDGRPPAEWPLERLPLPFETSMPNVFAIGDVRQQSIKRVASAVGEGSVAISVMFQHLRPGDGDQRANATR